nr:zinc finger, CCHC-type [Tanacetum cinerariifolium]
MSAATTKHMALKFAKLDKFKGVDFRRWQKKMHFLLSSMSVVYVLTTPIHDDGNDATVDQLRKRVKWDNDDYVCRGLILKVIGGGCVDLRFSSGKIILLFNVLHVPNMRKNLVSSSVLNNCGCKQVIESNKFVLSKHAFMSSSRLNDSILWHARLVHVHFKRMQDMSKDGLILAFDINTEKCKTCMLTKITKKPSQNVKRKTKVLELIHSDLCNLHATPLMGIKKYFLTFIDDASRYTIINENRFSSVPKDIGALVVPEEVTEKVVQQPELELRKSKRNRTPKDFGLEFQLYLIEGTRDDVSSQHSCCFNVEDDPKTLDEGMKFQDMDVKIAFLNGDLDKEVDLTKEFLSSRFFIKDMRKADVILGIRIKHESNGIAISQSHYTEKVLKKVNYFDCTPVSTPMDTSILVILTLSIGKQFISNTKDSSSTSGWVFLLGGGAISWASKKQTCITGSKIEYEFVALAAVGKEAEWLKNLLFEISLWSKPIASICIQCDSVATLAKSYSQMYNRKSRHLGFKHSLIRELITNENTCNNNKNLSEIQLENKKEDELAAVVVKEIENKALKEVERSLDGGLSKTLVVRMRMIMIRGKCRHEAMYRKVKDTEKEANLKFSFPPVCGPILLGGPRYIEGPLDVYGAVF